LSCAICVDTVEDSPLDLEGVRESSTNFAAGEGSVSDNPETVRLLSTVGGGPVVGVPVADRPVARRTYRMETLFWPSHADTRI